MSRIGDGDGWEGRGDSFRIPFSVPFLDFFLFFIGLPVNFWRFFGVGVKFGLECLLPSTDSQIYR